jgi:hypothetical protein
MPVSTFPSCEYLINHLQWIVYLAFSTEFALEAIISACLAYYLWKLRYGFAK